MAEYFVYILRCADGSYYTGVTNDWERRIAEHRDGLVQKAYTHNRRPLELVYLAAFSEITDAIACEKQIKGWSKRKKQALIEHDREALKKFSRRSHLSKW